MLVSRDYMTRLDERVFRSQPQPDVIAPPSRFYDIRPAVITSDWIQNASGIWYAEGRFITQDGIVDDSFVFPIWAPTANDEPETTANETRVFVVWRGRWEMIGSVGGGEGGVTSYSIEGDGQKYDGDLYFDSRYFSYTSSSSHTVTVLKNVIRGKLQVGITAPDAETLQITFSLVDI